MPRGCSLLGVPNAQGAQDGHFYAEGGWGGFGRWGGLYFLVCPGFSVRVFFFLGGGGFFWGGGGD